MLTENEYLIAWGIYLGAVIGLGAVWWRITRFISVRWLQNLLRALYFALLVTPAAVVADSPRMAPAIMIWLLEYALVDSDNLARVYFPMGLALGIALFLAFGEAFLRRRRN